MHIVYEVQQKQQREDDSKWRLTHAEPAVFNELENAVARKQTFQNNNWIPGTYQFRVVRVIREVIN